MTSQQQEGPTWRPTTRDGRHSVACVGETMVSFIPPHEATLEATDTVVLDTAGAESNVAMYLARHGVDARWVSRIGDDPFGRRVIGRVSAAGVDVSGVPTDSTRPTGLLFKNPRNAAESGGTRVSYYRQGSAASAMGPEVLEEKALRTASLWHFTGITPALSPSCRQLVETALGQADRPPVSFDVNYRPALWNESPADLLSHLAQAADIVFVGLDEAQELWGTAISDPGDVRSLLPSPKIVVVKVASHFATAFLGDKQATVPALAVDVVEPVGAGDAFAAGFLAALLRAEPVHRCLRLGHITAASALSVTGDHGPLPDATKIERLLEVSPQGWSALQVRNSHHRLPIEGEDLRASEEMSPFRVDDGPLFEYAE
ncbi:sugar kinase [Streptacidiphilus pinicola]|uniref:Sugar kinase n=1 Tax=Streptacidiphilus pinicola TaxID=2219663 RepID=A0A2X0IPN5_9ACTN|nr:sugar kinase [Streptacidiphilus pinicola]RAG87202.1 sugar kinase [Streptacidiphilus pinicola]